MKSYRLTGYTLILILSGMISCYSEINDSTPPQMHIEKRWQGIAPDFRTGDVSPDGKFFTDINWDTGNLEIVDLDSDSIHVVEGSGYNDGGYTWMSSFSNKGDQLAYEWYNYGVNAHELRIYSMQTNKNRTLIEATGDVYYWEPLEWKKEDDSILIAKHSEGSNWEMGFISAVDGGYRPIVLLNWNIPGGKNHGSYPYAVLSSDNAYIGFDYRLEQSTSMDLFVASVATGEFVPLWEGEGDDRFMFWDETDQYAYFYSDRSGVPSVWRLNTQNGKAIGGPELVVENVTGLTAIGKTDEGFAFGKSSGDFNTFYCTVDFESGKILQEPKMIDTTVHYRNNVGTWSRDGDSLVYVQFKSMPGGRESLVIQSIKDGGKREIMFPWDFHNKTGTVAWTSRSTVVIDGASQEHIGLHTLDLNSGNVKAAFDHGDKGFFQRFKTNSNGSVFYIEMRRDDPGIVAMAPRTNEITRLINGPVIPGSTCVSPDDRFLAFLRNKDGSINIEILDLKTNQLRTLMSKAPGVLNNPLVWDADGTGILAGVRLEDGRRGLWSIDVANPSNPVFIDLPEAFNSTLVASPNGRRVAYQGGTRRGELFYLTD